MKKRHLLVIASLGLMIWGVISYAKDISEVQPIDGSQRNQITITGGGGGGAGDVTAGGNNSFTGNNTYAGAETFNGLVTTSNVLTRGYLSAFGTNVTTGVYGLRVRPAPGATSAYIQVDEIGLGGAAAIEFKRGAQQWELGNEGSDNFRLNMSGSGNFVIRDDGVSIFLANDSGVTLGAAAGSQITMNGATHTIANTPQVNTDVWKWASAGGTLTNGTSLYSQNTLFASNMVTRSTDGFARWTTIAGVTNAEIIVNAGAGPLATKALYTVATNAITAALPVVNTIYTNSTGQRMRLIAGVNLPTGLTSVSAAAGWSVSGNFTNYPVGMTMSSAGVNGAITGSVMMVVQPGALYMVSNVTTTAGTPSLAQGLWTAVYE